MAMGFNASADKNIVDRSRAGRNTAVAKALRATRERLQTGGVAGMHFEREMLLLHVNAIMQGAAAPPLLVVLTSALGVYFTNEPMLAFWAVVTLTGYAGLVLMARRAASQMPRSVQPWRQRFMLAHFAIGLCWAGFALSACSACAGPSFVIFKGLMLLIALAMTAMATFTLRNTILFAFLPPVLALAATAFLSRNGYDIGLTAVLASALGFFLFVSARLHDSNLKLLSFQSEKDSLIAELEVAKSVSDEARRRAEEANLAKSRFLATMSHELRTPLNAILGFSEVMVSEVLGPMENKAYKDYVGDIHRSGQHLLNLINEILDLSRIEAGRYDLQEEAVALADIAEDCIGMVQMKARSKNIGIRSQFEPGLPSIWGDERALRQVCLNLLSNAVKFTPQGGHINVKVGWTAGGGQYMSIRDDGPGIPEEEIPIVLSAFGQGSIAIKSAEQGTGLGLPIVQAVLAKHDGEFVLKSKLREGTETIAILPAKRVLEGLPAVEDAPALRRRRKSFA